jgi:platelet-activating factor acetylhydrolase
MGMRLWRVSAITEEQEDGRLSAPTGKAFPGSDVWATLLKKIIVSYGVRIQVCSILHSPITADSAQIPVYEDAPLFSPPDGGRWPLVLFSHGLGGTATTYSALCMHLASRGRVVLALEHRDGSGAATFPRLWNGATRTQRYVSPAEVIWPDGATAPGADTWAAGGYNSAVALRFRADQLDFRRREMYAAFEAIARLDAFEVRKSALEVRGGSHKVDLHRWAGTLDCSSIDLVGHSFGGATLVRRVAGCAMTAC